MKPLAIVMLFTLTLGVIGIVLKVSCHASTAKGEMLYFKGNVEFAQSQMYQYARSMPYPKVKECDRLHLEFDNEPIPQLNYEYIISTGVWLNENNK